MEISQANHSTSPNRKIEYLTKAAAISTPQQSETTHSEKVFGLIKNGEITPAVNQATALFVKNSDKALSWEAFSAFIEIKTTLILFYHS